jgi:hypothetical protein
MSVRYRKSSLVNILAKLKLFISKLVLILCLLFMGYPMNILVFGSNALVPRNLVTHRHDFLDASYKFIHKPAESCLFQLKFEVRDTLNWFLLLTTLLETKRRS